jgi:hypothetical protein
VSACVGSAPTHCAVSEDQLFALCHGARFNYQFDSIRLDRSTALCRSTDCLLFVMPRDSLKYFLD